jgi:pimeloyl-ACP methyl ester carboxylesterase
MLAADAARVLDDCGIAAAHVVGLSMGAAVALELAIRMPQRVKSLVLVGGGAGGPATARPPLYAAASTVGSVLADSVRHRHPWPAAALFSDSYRKKHPDRVAEYMPAFARHRAPPWMTGWQALAIACFSRRGSLGRVRAPTLVLHGELDAMAPVANARLLADEIPGAELRIVRGAGHAVPLEHPESTARLLRDWVRRCASAQPATPRRRDVVGERLTRPFSLQLGTVRNTRDVAVSVARALRSVNPLPHGGRPGRRGSHGSSPRSTVRARGGAS